LEATVAFLAGGSTTGTELIKEIYSGQLIEGVYKNSGLLPLFGAPVDSGGGTKHQWHIHTTANDSVETFTEGQGQPDPGNQQYTSPEVSYKYFRGLLNITGHARDAMRRNWVNGLDLEMSMLKEDIVDLVTTTYMDATDGIRAAVDSTTTYAGVTRGSVTYFEANENAVNAIVSFGDLIDLYEEQRDNDIGARPDLILCPWNQYTRIYQITGQPAIKNIAPLDAASGYNSQVFAGMSIQPLGDLTDTVIFMLDRRPGNWTVVQHRPFQVKEMAPAGDSDVYQLSVAVNLICLHPKFQGKLTGCSA
jgi:hypothetical protein